MMTTTMDYQLIINLVATVLSLSLPIGITFALAEKLVNMFLSFAFGDKKVKF